MTSTAFLRSCDSMPRPGVREGVRVRTDRWDRTATPNTLTEEMEMEGKVEDEEEEKQQEEYRP